MKAIWISALTALLVCVTFGMWSGNIARHDAAAIGAASETVFERVVRTGTIRCGYFVWEPLIIKDPKTGQLSGLIYDYVNAIADNAKLKVDWSYEVSIATYIQDLKAGKYDMECIGGWPNAERAKFAAYTKPIAYYPLYAWVRADDTRFDATLDAANVPDVKIVMVDGGTDTTIYETQFAKATAVRLPSSPNGVTDLTLNVESKKADMLFADVPTMKGYMEANPGKMKPLLHTPVQIKKINISVAQGEHDFLNFLNEVGDILMLDGTVERLLRKYEPANGSYLRPLNAFKTE